MKSEPAPDPERGWLGKGPGLDELVCKMEDSRIKRKRAALIIPSYGRKGLLREHLGRLMLQSSQDFDVIIVHGAGEEFLREAAQMNAVQIQRRHDCGSAGGFYIGERFAMEEGYEFIIHADDDAFPDSESLIKDLFAAMDAGADAALPFVRIHPGAAAEKSPSIARYGTMRTSFLQKSGLTYLPFYFAGEDIELLSRMRRHGGRIADVPTPAYHPPLLSSMFANHPAKLFYYSRGGILGRLLGPSAAATLAEMLSILSFGLCFAPFRRQLSRSMLHAAFDTASMRLFRRKWSADEAAPEPADCAHCVKARHLTEGFAMEGGIAFRARSALSSCFRYFAQVPRLLGRDIVLEGAVGHSGVPLALLAKNSYLRIGPGGGCYPVFRKTIFWLFPLYAAYVLAALALALMLAPALTIFAYLNKHAAGAGADGYGIDAKLQE